MDSNAKKFLVRDAVLEVRIIVDSSCNNRSLTSAIVTMISYSFDCRLRPQIVAIATCGRRTRSPRASFRAVRVVQLFSTADNKTEVPLYYSQYLTVVAVSLVRRLSSRH